MDIKTLKSYNRRMENTSARQNTAITRLFAYASFCLPAALAFALNASADDHKIHENHSHAHGSPDCSHNARTHGNHVHYVHGNHKHFKHGDHWDECVMKDEESKEPESDGAQ